MSLIAEDPWENIGVIYKDFTVIDSSYNDTVAGDFEANYYARKVPDASGIEGELYGLAMDIDQNPNDDEYINTYSEIEQDWTESGFSINELTSEPVGDETTDYDVSASFTVAASPSGTFGVNVESPRIERIDDSVNDETTHHSFDYPGYYLCDNARCSRVVLGNVSKADVNKPSGDSFSYCPVSASGTFLHADYGDAHAAVPYFNPELSEL